MVIYYTQNKIQMSEAHKERIFAMWKKFVAIFRRQISEPAAPRSVSGVQLTLPFE